MATCTTVATMSQLHVRSVRHRYRSVHSITKQRIPYMINVILYINLMRDLARSNKNLFNQNDSLWNLLEDTQDTQQLLDQADILYTQGNYREAYNTLTRKIQDRSNVNVLWRLARLLYSTSSQIDTFTSASCKYMFSYGLRIIKQAYTEQHNNASVYKWYAVYLTKDNKSKFFLTKAATWAIIKSCLLKTHELNPEDLSVSFMLGLLTYNISTLKWYQKLACRLFNIQLPSGSLEEADNYFLEVEAVMPQQSLSNIYMLARISYERHQYLRMKHYLDIVILLPARDQKEEEYQNNARKFLRKLRG